MNRLFWRLPWWVHELILLLTGWRRYEPVATHWRWVGPPVAQVSRRLIAEVDPRRDLRPGDMFELGPWVVRVVDQDLSMDAMLVARCDGWGDVVAFFWPVRTAVQVFTMRLIWTLAVWGLATVPDGERVHWQHVHALRWLAERIGRWR